MYVRLSLLALLLAPASLLANVDTSVSGAAFKQLDDNFNGYVSRDEAAADEQFSARFDEYDLNADGLVSVGEYRRATGLPAEPRDGTRNRLFSMLDDNFDGYLSRKEASAYEEIAGDFAAWDENGDGRIDPREFMKFSYEEWGLDRQLQNTFLSLDDNFDGYVSREEAQDNETFVSRFDTWDVDHNGRLSPHEVLFHTEQEKETGLTFRQLDRNFDGFVSKREAWADHEVAEGFSEFDLDGDGRIGPSEYKAIDGGEGPADLALLEPMLERDDNRDGYLSKREAIGSPEFTSRFGEYDRDGDGRIAPQEFIAINGPQPGSVDQGLLPTMLELDVNFDGYVSRSEAIDEPSVTELFTYYDANADDRLSPNEVLYPAEREKVSGLSFDQLDVNLDGFVSKREAWADYELSLAFDTYDRDGNRRLGPTEFSAIEGVESESDSGLALLNTLRALDGNGDGYVSKAESAADQAFADKFADYDRNGDGRVAPQEYLAATGPAPESGGQGLLPLMASLDVNGDGYVSRREIVNEPALDGRFEAMDRDGDGRLDARELGDAELG